MGLVEERLARLEQAMEDLCTKVCGPGDSICVQLREIRNTQLRMAETQGRLRGSVALIVVGASAVVSAVAVAVMKLVLKC